MELQLEKRSQLFDVVADGRKLVIKKWEQGLKGQDSFESGWVFEFEVDKKWFEKLKEEDKKQLLEAIKQLKI